ncbi:hypothetical protein S40285_08753 [Stachybotrys chlorohalonatus IBT 40285]|uniref:Arsenite methyltransferase n=1 Tax=Stachybotrys chlorohalonatus (strain IBT 40285) TaxID=1283841 RepID=A0A084QZI0_STAC4|nr:hypothetical protein S40285_08753 [Stachybotrys chlorohalonata IBT 40285]
MATLASQTQVAPDDVEEAYSYRAQNSINDALGRKIAAALGYDPSDFNSAAGDANIGEGCGNPLLIANLKKVSNFTTEAKASPNKQVGTTGKVVGLDMTKVLHHICALLSLCLMKLITCLLGQNMIELAQKNCLKLGFSNVEFIHSNILKLPLADNSVDCVMSNCVLNLVPDNEKLAVIREIHRILKPCGRLAVSDFLALVPLPPMVKDDPALRSGCVSGALEVTQMKQILYDIGFNGRGTSTLCRVPSRLWLTAPDVLMVDTKKDLSLYKDGEQAKSVTPCCAGGASCGAVLTSSGRKELDYDLNEYISAYQIYGHKWCGDSEQAQPQVCSVLDQDMPLPQRNGGACCAGNGSCC